MEKSNRIVITNIEDKEKVLHAVLLIEGHIIHSVCNGDSVEELIVWNNEEKQKNHRLKGNNFKILLELEPNENHITINYCCILHNLNVFYERSNLERYVLPVYIINKNHDGRFQSPDGDASPESACRRISTGTKLLQSVIAHKLKQDHGVFKTFNAENCEIFYSNIDCDTARRMKQDDLWSDIAREIMNSKIGNSKTKYLGFLSCTRYNANLEDVRSYEDMLNATEGHVALGGGGLALFGSACLYTWPESVDDVLEKFEDDTAVDSLKFMNDSCFRNTIGGCFSTTLGSVLHELCHTFDLGHTKDGIMGRGFDNMNKFFLVEESSDIIPLVRNNGHAVKSKKLVEPYFTMSCSVLLNYHKFLNNIGNDDTKKYLLKFDLASGIVRSTNGIRVIEVREELTEMVLHSWTFTGKVLRYSFQLPTEYSGKILVVEDNDGNIIKEIK